MTPQDSALLTRLCKERKVSVADLVASLVNQEAAPKAAQGATVRASGAVGTGLKRQTNMRLTDHGRDLLARLASLSGIGQADVVEQLLRSEAQRVGLAERSTPEGFIPPYPGKTAR